MSNSKPAPGDLELVRAFVNTRDPDTGVDRMASAPSYKEWLAEAGESMSEDAAREDARRALLAAAFERERLAPLAAVSAEEIEQALGPASRRGSRDHVVFRQIRTVDREDANRAYARIAEKGESFESVARDLSAAPDRGALQQRALREIPSEARSVLSRLPEGRLSKPVRVDGAYFVFQLEARNRDPDPERTREREEVRERLRREKLDRVRRETWERLAADEGLASSGGGASASQETS